MNFFDELKRRNVFRVGLTYLVVAWLVVQVVNNLVPLMGVPDWVAKAILIAIIAGFPIALIFAWAFELTPEGIKRTPSDDEERAPAPAFGRKWDFVIIAGLIIALGYFVWERQKTENTSQTASGNASGVATLAVLPFANLSTDPEQEFFADGITEELLNSLARISDLEVTGRTSAFYFKGKNEVLRTIGEKLGVENVLEGSVRKSGDDVRITAQLINARTGYHLWSQTYDRKLDDIFAIQDDIAMSVADALQIALGVGELGRRPGMTRNVEAYNEFLLSIGPAYADATASGVLRAIGHLERAVEIDPDFALAWMALYIRYSVIVAFLPEGAPEYSRKSQDALARVRKIEPDSPSLLGITAVAETQRRNWIEADRLFDRVPESRRRQAANAVGINQYAAFLQTVGRAKDALAFLERLRRIDPLAPTVALSLTEAYAASGDIPTALTETDRSASLDVPQGIFRATAVFAALATHDRGEIDKRLRLYIASGDGGGPIFATIQPLLNDPDAALVELRRRTAEAQQDRNTLLLYVIAHFAAYLGDQDFALENLRVVVENTPVYIGLFGVWRPIFREVRRLPEFKELVRSQGLVDYWRASGNWGDFCHPIGDDDFECE